MVDATIIHGDARQLPLDDCTVDAVICDPPYSLSFMGRDWDRHDSPAAFQAWCEEWAREALRVLKPGGHLICFGGTRTFHRLTCAIEDAGFEIRDSIGHAHTVPVMGWVQSQGFPKSLDVSRAIDRAAGAARAADARHPGFTPFGSGSPRCTVCERTKGSQPGNCRCVDHKAAPATDDARRWQGYGTALRPAHEPIVCAQKPFSPVPFDWRLAANVHHALAGLLWLSLSPAKRAEPTSPSNPHAPHAATCVSALVAAATASSPDASAKTATYSSPAAASTCSNIAASWRTILAALSTVTKTSTTATRSSTTTALKTLNSLLAPLTSQTTMPRCECLTGGSTSSAPSAGNSSSDEWANWIATLSASVPESAIEGIALAACNVLANIAADLSSGPASANTARSDAQRPSTTPPAGSAASGANGAPSSSSPNGPADGSARSDARGSEVSYVPAWEPIVVARKPLAGKTVAQNVLAYGCGALNIDATRVSTTDSLNGSSRQHNIRGGRYGAATESPTHVPDGFTQNAAGRWPSNVVFSHPPRLDVDGQVIGDACADGCVDGCPVLELDTQSVEASRFFPVFRHTPRDQVFFPIESGLWEQPGDGSTRDASTSAGRSAVSSNENSPTGGSGNRPTEQFPTDTRYTTGTTTRSTTTSTTSCASPPNGMTTTTSGCGSNTGGSEALRSDAASVATTGSPPQSSTSGEPGRSTATARSAPRLTAANGSQEDASSSTRDDGRGTPQDFPASFPTFRYVAKAPSRERPKVNGVAHPTCKPVMLMRWLAKLCGGQPGSLILDPFAGSGSTLEAALLEGFNAVGVEQAAEYLPLIQLRIDRAREQLAAQQKQAQPDPEPTLFDVA